MKTIEIRLDRIAKRPTYTIGKLYIDGTYFCDTLEDTVRSLNDLNRDGDLTDPGEGKIYGETAIPAGVYDVVLTMSVHFGRVLPLLSNVLGFDGIRMHAGNKAQDSLGCILVGKNSVVGGLTNSRDTENSLVEKLKSYIKLGYKLQITIK